MIAVPVPAVVVGVLLAVVGASQVVVVLVTLPRLVRDEVRRRQWKAARMSDLERKRQEADEKARQHAERFGF